MNTDVGEGRAADATASVEALLPKDIFESFEVWSYRSAAAVLAGSHPKALKEIIDALRRLKITETMIRTPGGSKGPIAKHFDSLMPEHWRETRISGDLKVRLLAAKGSEVFNEFVRPGFIDGHRIDFLSGRVAFDLEWNSKDQTYDRDLYAFSAFHSAGAIDVGVILTRGSSIDNDYLRSLGRVLNKDGSEGSAQVLSKFGASTTWMGKLLYRLDAGRNGGCPVLALGITPQLIARE